METQAPINHPIAIATPKAGGNMGNGDFFYPLFGALMIGNEHQMLTKFLKFKPFMFHGYESEDAY